MRRNKMALGYDDDGYGYSDKYSESPHDEAMRYVKEEHEEKIAEIKTAAMDLMTALKLSGAMNSIIEDQLDALLNSVDMKFYK